VLRRRLFRMRQGGASGHARVDVRNLRTRMVDHALDDVDGILTVRHPIAGSDVDQQVLAVVGGQVAVMHGDTATQSRQTVPGRRWIGRRVGKHRGQRGVEESTREGGRRFNFIRIRRRIFLAMMRCMAARPFAHRRGDRIVDLAIRDAEDRSERRVDSVSPKHRQVRIEL